MKASGHRGKVSDATVGLDCLHRRLGVNSPIAIREALGSATRMASSSLRARTEWQQLTIFGQWAVSLWRSAVRALLSLGMLLAFGLSVAGACWVYLRCSGSIGPGQCGTILGKDVFDYQTLIAGAMALLAAFVTLLPALRQLRATNIQASVMTREVIAQRMREVETRQKETRKNLAQITNEFFHRLFPGDPEAAPDINVHWAFEAEHVVDRVVDLLKRDQQSKADPSFVDSRREKVIAAATALRSCLYQIHAPGSTDPTFLSEVEIAALEPNARLGETQLVDRLSVVKDRAAELDQAFETRLSQLRQLLRQIDDLVVDCELGLAKR